jgi:hypothetical protein
VVEAQNTKVVAMKETGTEVGVKKLETIQIISTELGKKTDDPQALSNINANAMNAIVRVSNEDRVVREIGQVDGTSKVVGSIAGKGIESTEMSTLQYGMYATAQGAIGMQAFPVAAEQMRGIARWGWGKVGMVLGGVFGGGGLIAGLVTFIRRALVRRRLLEADGQVIEELGEEKKEDATLKELKSRLAKAHAGLPVDARKEHGLPEKTKKEGGKQ